jgi:hypothetical protein
MKASYFPNNCNPSALWCVGYPNFAPATNYKDVVDTGGEVLQRLYQPELQGEGPRGQA